jgi:hypothetical protein
MKKERATGYKPPERRASGSRDPQRTTVANQPRSREPVYAR